MSIPTCLVGLLAAALMTISACSDDPGRRPIGASCSAPAQCVSGICGGGACLDPAVDTDQDGLLNGVEAALGTDPTLADSDGDGVNDGDEVGADINIGVDSDGDGRIDAIESAIADCDRDQIPDQDDSDDGFDAKGFCTFDGGDEVCTPICDATVALGCEGITAPGCQSQCMAFADEVIARGCATELSAFAACVASARDLACPEGPESGPDQLPELPLSCELQIDALDTCSDAFGTTCPEVDDDNIEVGITVNAQSSGGDTVYRLTVEAGVAYDVVLTGFEGSGNADLLVFSSEQQRCDYSQIVADNDGDESAPAAVEARLGKSSNPAGQTDIVSLQGPTSGQLDVVVAIPTGETVSYRLSVELVQIAE